MSDNSDDAVLKIDGVHSYVMVQSLMRYLLPNGYDGVLEARGEALKNMSRVTYEADTLVKIMGATVEIKITFDGSKP